MSWRGKEHSELSSGRIDEETISISDYIITVQVTEKSLVFSKI